MSEDLILRTARDLGRLAYISLGSTTLAQLKRSRFIRSQLAADEERRKPDGIIFLPLGGIKAVIEAKQPKELTSKRLPDVVKTYSPIAKAVCKLLIITDGKASYWYNALTERPILEANGNPVRKLVDLVAIDSESLSEEEESELVHLIDQADRSLTDSSDQLQSLEVIDPSGLARSVWQKIWINTGKEPEKCLYNVVELFLFKFLSDINVLKGTYSFRHVLELLVADGPDVALEHYGRISRRKVRELFPEGKDRTTVINGTIFVNEKGEPNRAQATLFAEVIRSIQKYDDQNGSLRYIVREFKTRLYESFLRQQAGIKSLGQFFTPRNVVRAIVDMSPADALRPGDSLCDPFCGVGGFLLEAIVENQNLYSEFEPKNGKVSPRIVVKGFDKGSDEKDDERTIILAKANMLVYLSDLLSQYHSEAYLAEFAQAFNSVFNLLRSNLGTFELVEDQDEKYDLILTNPPYVTSGSASIRAAIESRGLADYYANGGRGTEALAMQWIVDRLKPNGEAYVIVPDGLMNQSSLLAFIKDRAEILCIIALPSRTFYSTPKKTYILGLRRKPKAAAQTAPVFTYLVSEIGESRDTRRAPIEANDLSPMAEAFALFKAGREYWKTDDPRCRLIEWLAFDSSNNWLIERSWTHSEKVELGIADEAFEVDEDGFLLLVGEARAALDSLMDELK